MKRIMACALAGALGLAGAVASAQVAGKSTLGITVVEEQSLVMGYSAKKDLLGKPVMNDQNQKVGTIEDLIVSKDRTVTAAIINAGGFVGLAKHEVAIPTDQLKFDNGKLMLPGATKDALKGLPEFKYSKGTEKEKTGS
jgi:sporulation protein YlmC with PRC-barrel domain